METGCQLVPKMYSVTFLSGFCPQTINFEQLDLNVEKLVPKFQIIANPEKSEVGLPCLPRCRNVLGKYGNPAMNDNNDREFCIDGS